MMHSLEPTPRSIDILGSSAQYWVYHDDRPRTIVAIHGFRGTHHGLLDLINNLPDFRVIVPDLPGFGESTPMTERRHDIAGYSDFAKQFIRAVAPKQPIVLGHSFGSIVSADLAATAPELVSKLILINPIVAPNTNPIHPAFAIASFYYWFGGKLLTERLGLHVLRNKAIILASSALMAKTHDKKLRKTIHAYHLQHFGSFQNRNVVNESYNASITRSVSEYAAQITLPTLLIAGALDAIAPAKGQYLLEKLFPNARLVMLSKVGHLIHYETPKEAAEAIRQFLL